MPQGKHHPVASVRDRLSEAERRFAVLQGRAEQARREYAAAVAEARAALGAKAAGIADNKLPAALERQAGAIERSISAELDKVDAAMARVERMLGGAPDCVTQSERGGDGLG